jgi:hypothetical protein
VQFHPEVTREILEVWLTQGHGQLSQENLDADALRTDAARYVDAARIACHGIVDHFLDTAFADHPGLGVSDAR